MLRVTDILRKFKKQSKSHYKTHFGQEVTISNAFEKTWVYKHDKDVTEELVNIS